MPTESYHEPLEWLTPETITLTRAITSLIEELEAVVWYQQRVDATRDPQLKAILKHNRDEEVEHASMILEWLRRKDPVFETQLRRYLFTAGDIVKIEEENP